MRLTVRKSAAGTKVIFQITSGQMMCPSYDGCSGRGRFDDGKPWTVSFAGSADSSSEVIFLESGERDFVAKLKTVKRLIVEKTLYQAGSPQFEFDVSGLQLEPLIRRQSLAILRSDRRLTEV